MFHALVFYNTWETLFCAHFGELLPQKSQNNNFIKICLMYFSVFMLLQLPAKKPRFVIKHEKLILGHFLSQNPSARFFLEKSSCSVLSFYAAVTSHKKSDMFHKLSFDYTWKTSFWAHIWGLSPQNSENKNFLKICFNQILTFMLLPIHAKNQKIKCISLPSFTTTFRSKTWGQDFHLSHFEAFMQLKLHAQWSEKV